MDRGHLNTIHIQQVDEILLAYLVNFHKQQLSSNFISYYCYLLL